MARKTGEEGRTPEARSDKAFFGTEISVGRFEKLIRNVMNIKRGGLLGYIGECVSPSITLFQPPDDFATRLAVGVESYSLYRQANAGGAGNANIYSLTNPLGSGVIATIDYIRYSVAAAGAIIVEFGDGAAPGLVAPGAGSVFRDTRQLRDGLVGSPGAPRFSACQTNLQVAVPPAAAARVDGIRNGTAHTYPPTTAGQAVLSPGYFIRVYCDVLNQADACAFGWSERVMELSERDP